MGRVILLTWTCLTLVLLTLYTETCQCVHMNAAVPPHHHLRDMDISFVPLADWEALKAHHHHHHHTRSFPQFHSISNILASRAHRRQAHIDIISSRGTLTMAEEISDLVDFVSSEHCRELDDGGDVHSVVCDLEFQIDRVDGRDDSGSDCNVAGTAGPCQTLEHTFHTAQYIVQSIISDSRYSDVSIVINVDVKIVRPGLYEVHEGILFISDQQYMPDDRDAELRVQERWRLTGLEADEQVTITASPSSLDLGRGTGTRSLFEVIIVDPETNENPTVSPFSITLEGLNFHNLTSVLSVFGIGNHPRASVQIDQCLFEDMQMQGIAALDIDNMGGGAQLHVSWSTFRRCNAGAVLLYYGTGHNVTMNHVEMADNNVVNSESAMT